MKDWVKRLLIALVFLAIAGLAHQTAASAAATFQAKSTCKLYSSISRTARTRKVNKGRKVIVYAVKGNWCKVSISGVKGYMPKSSLTKATKSKSKSSSVHTLRGGDRSAAVKKLQSQMAKRGFISAKSVNGYYGSSTAKAIRQYQMMSGLSVSGTATAATIKKLFSSNGRRPSVTKTKWNNYSCTKIFPVGSLATIVDLNTGARLRVRRVGGHNHYDVEPAYASDTAVLKRLYGGTWSWDSRGVLLISRGHYVAGAINGMPHGYEMSHSNNFDGQICLHLNGSKTHGSGDSNSAHQANIRRVYNYFN